MEDNNHEVGEERLAMISANPEATSLEFIRTETVLSRLPVHNLAKQGRVNIQIIKTTPTGEVELKWEVSYSDRYGQARQLAYRLDTIIINQRIDEAGRPLPKMLRIGSLNEICAELNMATHAGQNTKDLKRAFLQNASAFITAKFNYRANDGTERHVEAGVTRYGVIFTGEKLPDGRKADAVYITFNDPFWEVLNNAPVRPLDRAYMKELPPAAQRFYEIISRKIFAALKNDYARAKISYSEYCTFSAQLRHFERQPVQDQMAKLLRPHKKFGYITEVRYEPTIDTQNQPDWIMYLTPGPRAHAEFAAAHRTRKRPILNTDPIETGEQEPKHRRAGIRERSVKHKPLPQSFDAQLVSEFTRRGITEKKTRDLLAHLKPGQDAVAQLELGDQHIEKNPGKYTNPAGFYIHLVEENTPIPNGFETNAQRKAREEEERRRDEERRAQRELETEYEWYRDNEIERFIGSLDPAEVAAVREVKRQEMEAQHKSPWIIDSFAEHETRRELTKRVPLMTIEEFKVSREQGTALPSKPVPEPLTTEATIEEPVPVSTPLNQAPIDEAPTTGVADFARPGATPEAPAERSPEPAKQPAMSEPAIEQVSELPASEPNPDPMEP
jgi:hypothetical protein